MEEAALGFAAGLALLLEVVGDEFVVHEVVDGALGLAEVSRRVWRWAGSSRFPLRNDRKKSKGTGSGNRALGSV